MRRRRTTPATAYTCIHSSRSCAAAAWSASATYTGIPGEPDRYIKLEETHEESSVFGVVNDVTEEMAAPHTD